MWISHRKEIRKLTPRAIRSDEKLTLEASAFEPLYGGQLTSSTHLIKPNYLVILRTGRSTAVLQKRSPSILCMGCVLVNCHVIVDEPCARSDWSKTHILSELLRYFARWLVNRVGKSMFYFTCKLLFRRFPCQWTKSAGVVKKAGEFFFLSVILSLNSMDASITRYIYMNLLSI